MTNVYEVIYESDIIPLFTTVLERMRVIAKGILGPIE